ncbi:MAG: hypothetical protein F6K54_11995 [Okeania sp. SIO3B5]|nr:hypothetical protein [Okeania sp. SIO3B5]
MRDNLEEVEATRVPVSKLPEGHKGDKQESGILNIELSLANIKTLITFLWERLSGKATEVEVKIDKKGSIKLKVGSQKDLPAAIQDVEKLVKSVSESEIKNTKVPVGDPTIEYRQLVSRYVEAYREGSISSGKLRELFGFSTPLEADNFLKSKGVDLDYDEEDFMSDRQTHEQLEKEGKLKRL